MSRLMIILLSVLAVIYVCLSVLDEKGEYYAERSLWRINKDFEKVMRHKETATNYEIEQLKTRYRKFIGQYPGSLLSASAQLMVGNLALLKKDHAGARAEFEKAVPLSEGNQDLLANIHTSIAQSYQYAGQWTQAETVYKKIIAQYPLTRTGFFVPLYLARYHENNGRKEQAYAAFDEAHEFYRRMAATYTKSAIEYDALHIMAICRVHQNRYQEAVEAMGEWMTKYPSKGSVSEAMRAINALSILQLHDYDTPIAVYKRFIKAHPKHPVSAFFAKTIKHLELLKSKKIVIKTRPNEKR